jgi:hypothetical protein
MTMKRRLLVSALACWPAVRLAAQDQPRHKVSAAELHKALSARFPRRFGPPGLLEVQVSAPQLLLLPARNMLGASLVVQVSGPAVQPLPAGEMELVFRPRYEPSDRTLRASQPEVLDVRLPGAPPESTQAFQRVLPALMREVLGEYVLHRFSGRELALADTMGFEPEQLTVVDDGLLVQFARKRTP